MDEVYALAVDCVAAIGEQFSLFRVEAESLFRKVCGVTWRTAKYSVMSCAAMFATVMVSLLVVAGCFTVSLLGSFFLRYYILANAPGSQLFTLDLNTMPYETEFWRLRRLDSAVSSHVIPMLSPPPLETTPHVAEWSAQLSREAASLKMGLLTRQVAGTLGTGTLLIPSMVAREVFPPGGGVSMEALFRRRRPMFNARGVYQLRAQLVFARETRRRDVPLMLESSILIAEDPDVPQALSTLDVLFKSTASFVLSTADKGSEGLLWSVVQMAFRLAFIVPLWTYEAVAAAAHSDVFPAMDNEREVGVTLSVYDAFEPPAPLQLRLRAINFTVYQDSVTAAERARLTRMHLHASVELSGAAYYFSTYPVMSFAAVTLVFLVALLTLATVAGAASLTALAVYVTKQKKSSRAAHIKDAAGDDEEEEEEGEEEEEDSGDDRIVLRGSGVDISLQSNTPWPPVHDAEMIPSELSGMRRSSSFQFYELDTPIAKEKKSK